MKKRLGAMLIMVGLILTPMSVAAEDILRDIPEIENFSLHSGTMFGDTVANVKSKEEEAGFFVSDETEMGVSDEKMVFFNGMFAGISDSGLRYTFHRDKSYTSPLLYSSMYGFGYEQGHDYDSQSEDFDTITEELIKKYGDPIYNEGEGTPFILLNYKGNNMVTGWAEYNYKKQAFASDEIGIFKYNQWIVKTEDNYVLIDHCIHGTWFNSSSSWYYDHNLIYLSLDKQTVLETLESYERTQKEKTDSINNDL